ncbi:two-component regulator propeller domain-containing protein [Rubrivivax sp. RP6-9]|uniref:two-component regulator propeller domain-containing protein n=1 Tax=Rubrivivax sp. RP6-9 TaxID=3415750 RepID=UPI003CC5B605
MNPPVRARAAALPAWRGPLWLLACLWSSWVLWGTPAMAAPERRWSQVAQDAFEHLTLQQGLPNEIAMAVAQDGEGFLWIGTLGGLARWDGYRLQVHRSEPGTAGALPDNVIQTLHGDAAGRLWIGTSSGGLVRHDRASGRFVTLGAGPQGLSHVSVHGIADDGQGGLWVATAGGLDALAFTSEGRLQRRPPDPAVERLRGRRVLAVLRSRDGALWVGTDIGLLRRAPEGGAFVPVPLAVPQRDATAAAALASGATLQAEVHALLEDSAGQLWAGTAHAGAFVIAPGQAARPVREQPDASGVPLSVQQVSSITEVRPGEVWLGTVGHGIVAVDGASGQTRRIRRQAMRASSLADNSVRSVVRDRSGLVWVASNRGLSRHDPRQTAILTLFGHDRAAPGLVGPAGTEISWILPGNDGRIWLGTHKSGVEIIDTSGARVGGIAPDADRPETALPQDIVLGLERTRDGSVFVATKRGLYRTSADGRQVARVLLGRRNPTASTWALLADGDTLWAGGQSDGLWQLDLRSGRGAPLALAGALSDERITVLARGPGGSLWVGTRHGLNRVDPASGAVLARVLPSPAAAQTTSDAPGLAAGFVTAVHTDRSGRAWIGTYGGGVHLLQPGDGPPRFRRITAAQGLPDDNVNALVDDAEGRVWVSTDNGLAVIDPQTLAVRGLHRAEGALFATYWTGSAARTPDGDLLFGGAGGLSIVRPERLQAWDYRPPVVVSALHVGGRPVPAPAASAPLQVPADANSLAVEFSALDFSAPERNRYAYRLLGFESRWNSTDAARRLALYNNLPPGRYTLQLRGSNRDGLWADAALELPLQVQAAWHQTLWFRASAVVALALLLLAVVQWRTRLLRARQAELERKVSERTAELQQMSQALTEKSLVLERSSVTDPLTGLHNRRFLTSRIDTEIAASLRRATEPVTAGHAAGVDTDNVFFLVDVDHFKRVNDRHGHAAGDSVLVQFGQRLQGLVRETDFLVRWGGEEFLVVARNTDRSRAQELAGRIRDVVAQAPFVLDDGSTLAVSCSIGFACMPFVRAAPRALDWQDVVQLADLALLAAKRAGRNTWVGLQAGPAARPDGLRARVQAAPRQALQAHEVVLVTGGDLARVLDTLPVNATLARL